MGLGSCARVTLPPGRTAFLVVLLADLSLKTVPFILTPFRGKTKISDGKPGVPHFTDKLILGNVQI